MLDGSQSKGPATVRPSAGFRAFLARHAAMIRWVSVALILVAVLLLMRTLPTQGVLESAQGWVDSLGMWGPLVFGVTYVVAVLLFIPGSILTLVAGAVYGLIWGTVIVSLASTTAAALAFLIARYLARDKVRRRVEQTPKLVAVDEAIGDQGWKIVALLRLSPAVPFSLQNYLYGVTAIRFWPCVVASWVAMLPGTFLYVYLGSLGKTAAAGEETSTAEWIARGVGLAAAIAVTVYIARLARNAIERRTHIEESDQAQQQEQPSEPSAGNRQDDAPTAPDDHAEELSWPWSTLLTAALAITLLVLALWATVRRDAVRNSVERLLGMPPTVTAVEAYAPRRDGPTFGHSTFNALLQSHVDAHGWVDYRGVREDAAEPDEYLGQLADAFARFGSEVYLIESPEVV